jgi:hypothetical protein
MNELMIRGVVLSVLPEETGTSKAGKEWKKQDFVIETIDQYPKKVAFTAFGDKTDLLMKISEGMTVDVSFNLESREYNGKYFHNVNCWKIIVDQGQSVPAPQYNTPPPATNTAQSVSPADDGDALPF